MSNPFLILADSTPSPYSTATSKAMPTTSDSPDFYKDLLESILLCTVDEQPTSSAVYLADLAGALPNTWDNNLVDQALFERLRMSDPSAQLVTRANPSTRGATAGVAENRCLVYLAGCYQRLLQQRDHFKSVFDEMQKLFVDHSKTAISLPDLYDGQDLTKQWMALLLDGQENSSSAEFTDRINKELDATNFDEVESLYQTVFVHMYKAIQPLDYFSTELFSYVGILSRLAQWPGLVRVRVLFQGGIFRWQGDFLCRSSFDARTRKPPRIVLRKILTCHRAVAMAERSRTHSWALCCPNPAFRRSRESRFSSSTSRSP